MNRKSKKSPKREPGAVVRMIAPNGHEVALAIFPSGSTVLAHMNEKGEVLSRTCSGTCGSGKKARKVGPIDCPKPLSPALDCTVDPPTLKCV